MKIFYDLREKAFSDKLRSGIRNRSKKIVDSKNL